jgi:hypothetical protein
LTRVQECPDGPRLSVHVQANCASLEVIEMEMIDFDLLGHVISAMTSVEEFSFNTDESARFIGERERLRNLL